MTETELDADKQAATKHNAQNSSQRGDIHARWRLLDANTLCMVCTRRMQWDNCRTKRIPRENCIPYKEAALETRRIRWTTKRSILAI